MKTRNLFLGLFILAGLFSSCSEELSFEEVDQMNESTAAAIGKQVTWKHNGEEICISSSVPVKLEVKVSNHWLNNAGQNYFHDFSEFNFEVSSKETVCVNVKSCIKHPITMQLQGTQIEYKHSMVWIYVELTQKDGGVYPYLITPNGIKICQE